MRTHSFVLLALPTLWSASVAAVPSPAAQQQQLLSTSSTTQSRWRSLSDRIVEAIWAFDKPSSGAGVHSGATKQTPHAPPHSFARYGGDVVLRFNISTAEEARSISEAADTLLLDIWEFSKHWVDIRLAKDVVPSLLGLLTPSLQNSHTPLLLERELAQAVYDTYPTPHNQRPAQPAVPPSHLRDRPFSPSLHTNGAETNIFFSDYQPLSVIQPWLRLLSSLFTTHVRLISIGVSYQGREIPGVRVGVHPTNSEDPTPKKRKTVVITGGLHAREWIGTSTVNYVAYSLITAYGKDPRITKLLEDFDFVFIPTLNPDGYVYTWETDRLWRKNRQQTNIRFCPGIDLDRGFGYHWDGVATASNPCSESFGGASPFEATEAEQFAAWARNETENNNVDFVGFLDFHSYSQEILYPYSYTCELTAPGQENLEELALGLEKTIRVSSGQIYEVMPACEGNVARSKDGKSDVLLPRIEDAGGSALDWFYHEMHVRYAYQIKLRDRGTYGFLLPKENIVPTGNEIWQAVLYYSSFLSDVYGAGAKGEVEFRKPDFTVEADSLVDTPTDVQNEEIFAPLDEQVDESEPWIWVEDLPDWDLKRRRRR